MEEFSAKYNTRQRQQRASEDEEKKGKDNEKDRERRAQQLLQMKTSQDKDGEVQDMAVLKQELQNLMKK